jgi:signal transduction histidine kinase
MRRRIGTRKGTSRPRTRLDRALAITLVSGVGLLVILGLVFSMAYGSKQITSRATDLHNADETLRSATVARAQVGLAVHLLTVDDVFGTNSAEAIDLSVSEAEVALQDLQAGADRLEADATADVTAAVTAARRLGETTETTLQAVKEGDVDAARALSVTHDDDFQTALTELERLRNQLAQSVEASDDFLGRVGTGARFLVAFLIPAAVIFIYRDLLLRQHRHTELEGRLESERRLSRAREEFIANASHELRTPLTGISGLAQILAEDPAITQSPTATELLDLIISESHDLARMVEDLLTTARLDAGALHFDFDYVSIHDVVRDVVEPMVKAGTDIEWDCEPAVIRADGLRTRQVLRNLLSNAQKYGGSHIEIRGAIEGRTYRCEVIDDGEGVPESIRDHMFERFVQRGRAGVSDSVGLGLAIVHALTHGMGGSVTYRRAARRTVFTVRLPLAEDLTALDHEWESGTAGLLETRLGLEG